MRAIDVVLERETANDETALVVAIHALSGTAVAKDAVIFEFENSKATQEQPAPESGILLHDLKIGDSVGFGVPVARIVPESEWNGAAAVVPEQPPPAAVVPVPVVPVPGGPMPVLAERPVPPPRFSQAAATLLVEYGLTPSQFTTEFVTARDVRAMLHLAGGEVADAPVVAAPPVLMGQAGAGQAGAGQAVAGRKRAEIDALSKGAGATMLSVLGTTIGPLSVRRAPDDAMAGRITDLVIYEASRLLRTFPLLNAAYADGRIVAHAAVHAGIAIDSGGRLMVYGIENADQASLPELGRTITDAVARYMDNELTAAELSRATFTVTDLSAGELDFVLPLLPRGQSCILGITHAAGSGFRIFAGFDHRVTEGREVAAFLEALRARLLSFAERPAAAAAECAFCGRSASDAAVKSRDKGLLRIVDRHGQDALCCASCWNDY